MMPYVRTVGQLGQGQAQSKAPLVGAGISAGLFTAAHFDPEVISKAILYAMAAIAGPIANLFRGCGPTCVQATEIVNQVEPYLKQNVDYYFAGPRTVETQQAALKIFDDAWSQVLAACGNPSLGDAGRRCISERQAGGSAPWCPTGTGCDWFILYRNPIANDPNVNVTKSSSLASFGGFPSFAAGGGSLLLPVLGVALIGGALLAGGRS